jgi:hypothetical protein
MTFRHGVVALAALVSSACAHDVPLGGIGAGRGRPIHEGLSELMMGAGVVPNISGTAPALADGGGHVLNPVLSGEELRLRYPLLDLGIALPLGDRADLGWSLSRGLHGMAEIVRARQWSLSLSPAFFWWKRGDALAPDARGSTRNLNLTALASYRHVVRDDDAGDPETAVELWAGAGANRYRIELEADDRLVNHSASPLSVVAGGSIMARGMRVGVEGGGAWVRQRERPREFAPAARLYVSYVLPSVIRRNRVRPMVPH